MIMKRRNGRGGGGASTDDDDDDGCVREIHLRGTLRARGLTLGLRRSSKMEHLWRERALYSTLPLLRQERGRCKGEDEGEDDGI